MHIFRVSWSIAYLRPSAGIAFVRNFAASLGAIEIDAGVLRLALINILENALDACIENEAQKSPKIIFSVQGDDKQIKFEIMDNGVGMDQETRESLFTLFFSSKGNKGTGLGLFIADKIVDQHGGKIRVESKPGCGSNLKISIPKIIPQAVKTSAGDFHHENERTTN